MMDVAGRIHPETLTADEVDVLDQIYRLTDTGTEVYSGDVFRAWGVGDRRRSNLVIRRMFRYLVEFGELSSRLVLPDEHRGSRWTRRYYRMAEI
jgi:uncharacterized membrane protein YgcG